MDERREQVVGGVLPDQEDADGDFAQTDPAGGPGWRPVVRREGDGAHETEPAPTDESRRSNRADEVSRDEAPEAGSAGETASGGYGSSSGYASSGGSQSGGENLATGSATEFLRGEAPNDLDITGGAKASGDDWQPPALERRGNRPAADTALPRDVEGE